MEVASMNHKEEGKMQKRRFYNEIESNDLLIYLHYINLKVNSDVILPPFFQIKLTQRNDANAQQIILHNGYYPDLRVKKTESFPMIKVLRLISPSPAELNIKRYQLLLEKIRLVKHNRRINIE
jgi:hypothetical protein